MTNAEMVNKYLHSIGYTLVAGENLEPLLPFCLLDAMYQIYQKDVRPIECRHQMKQWKKRWIDAYCSLNRQFFHAFKSPDEQDEVIDKFDALEAYIGNDIMIAEVQVMNFMRDLETEHARICASLIVCNVLAQSAQIFWKHVYKNARGGIVLILT